MRLRTDHVAGGAVIAAGLLIWALSGDLPTGRLSMPGAGMMPKLLCILIVFFGAVLILRAQDGGWFGDIDWSDLRHAGPVIGITVVAVALYATLGFVITMAAMLFALLAFERRNLLAAAAYSVSVSVATYALFVYILKTPLEPGLLQF
jgi:hypothetical protein